ncbi:MAG: pyridoxal phosphate-dependent aminotransferase [Flavobacteriales bacterium]|nr:pyridoxal phosphate-dependent aminotransferase [Flavobacteriales bacterium]
MEVQTSRLLGRLSESATLAMSRMARELKSEGRDIISLSLGEPDFDTPDPIKEAACQAIADNYTHYMPVPGYLEVREAICKKLLRDNGLEYTPSQIVISTGAKQSLMNTVLSLVDEHDEVILASPYWVSYADMVNLSGATLVDIKTGISSDFKMTPAQLKAALTPRTRLIFLNSPCNPSGSVYSLEELEALAAVIDGHQRALVIADEIYEYIQFGEPHVSFAGINGMMDRTITVNGVSKGFAMTGWRIGYIAAPQWIAAACSKLQGQFTSGASGISQKAAQAAVEHGAPLAEAMRVEFGKRREIMIELLGAVRGFQVNHPTGAFYLFPDVSELFGAQHAGGTINSGQDLAMYLLKNAGVATVGGDAFGSPDCLRISYAAGESTLREAVRRISVSIEELSF